MNTVALAALASWKLDWRVISLLILTAAIYLRGWVRGRRLLRDSRDEGRLVSFLAAIVLIFLAVASPLDTFDSLFLSAHMAQHLLLMMVAPALVLLGDPALPFLRGLPKPFVKEALGPFLTWPALRRFFHWLTSPFTAWSVFVGSTVFWHLPFAYELACRATRVFLLVGHSFLVAGHPARSGKVPMAYLGRHPLLTSGRFRQHGNFRLLCVLGQIAVSELHRSAGFRD